jgi:hypothetical protein
MLKLRQVGQKRPCELFPKEIQAKPLAPTRTEHALPLLGRARGSTC